MFVILPEPTIFAAFLAAATVLIISPGPDTLYVASRSLAQGRLSGLVAAMGVFAGVFVHISAAALGLAGLFAYAPLAYDVLRWVGDRMSMLAAIRNGEPDGDRGERAAEYPALDAPQDDIAAQPVAEQADAE